MSKINVYHLRTKDTETVTKNNGTLKVGGRPYATVAIEINDDGTVNRGVSICSAKDAFVKKVGTRKAVGRLESAKMRNANVCPIGCFKSTERRILKKIGGVPRFNTCFDYLGSYRVKPTVEELEMFKSDFEHFVKS